jgi:hypothetical protein
VTVLVTLLAKAGAVRERTEETSTAAETALAVSVCISVNLQIGDQDSLTAIWGITLQGKHPLIFWRMFLRVGILLCGGEMALPLWQYKDYFAALTK